MATGRWRHAALVILVALAGAACGGTARARLEPPPSSPGAPSTAALLPRASSAPAAPPPRRPPARAAGALDPGAAREVAPTTIARRATPGGATTTTTTSLGVRPAAGPSCRAPEALVAGTAVAYAKSLLPSTPVTSGHRAASVDRTWVVVTVDELESDTPVMSVLLHCVGMEWTVVASGRDRARLAPCGATVPDAVRATLGVC